MDKDQLSCVLVELSNSSKLVTSEEQLHSLMKKYDIIFAGESFNCILSLDLLHVLDKTFHIKTSLEEVNNLLPSVCAELGMEIVPMVRTSDSLSLKPYAYHIYL